MPVRTKPNAPPRDDPRDALPRLDHFKPKCGPVAKSKNSRWRAIVLVSVYLLVGLHVVHWLLAGRTLTPVEPSEAMQTLEGGYVNAGAILFVLLIASTLVFGRWFCGWACHIVALQDLCAWLLGKLGLRPRPVRSRVLVLVPFLLAANMFLWPTLKRWWNGGAAPELQSHLTTDDLWVTFPGPWMAVFTFVVCGFLIVWWLGAKGFCTYGCPYGAVFAITDRFASGRIRVTDACEHCGHCTSVCTSNVRVHEEVARHGMVVDPGCMKCMDCVSVCPKDALYFGFGKIAPFSSSQQRRQARADFSWPEEVGLLGAGVLGYWIWHGLWITEPVPNLMAVALAVITAVFLLLGWRLLVRRDVTFQHRVVKQAGRFTRTGMVTAVSVAAFAFVVGWLATAEVFRREAVAARFEIGQSDGRTRQEQIAAAEASAARAVWWSPARDPRLLELRGLLLRDLFRHDEAEAVFREAVARVRHPAVVEHGALALANYRYLHGDRQGARALAERVLEKSPQNATAHRLVEMTGGG